MATTLVSDGATAYLTLRELDYSLEISQRTLRTRQQSLELTRSRQTGGVATLLDLRQAEQLVQTLPFCHRYALRAVMPITVYKIDKRAKGQNTALRKALQMAPNRANSGAAI